MNRKVRMNPSGGTLVRAQKMQYIPEGLSSTNHCFHEAVSSASMDRTGLEKLSRCDRNAFSLLQC